MKIGVGLLAFILVILTFSLFGCSTEEAPIDPNQNVVRNRCSVSNEFTCMLTEVTKSKIVVLLEHEFGIKSRLFKAVYCMTLQAHATWLASTLHKAGVPRGRKARIVRIPKFIFTLPKEHRFAFLAGYFDGDGGIEKKNDRLASIIFNTYSKRMAKDLQLMLLGLGVVSSFRDRSKQDNGYTIVILGGEHIRKFMSNCNSWKIDFSIPKNTKGYCNLDTIPSLGATLRDIRLNDTRWLYLG